MRSLILSAALAAALAAPACAGVYPVSGNWGQSASSAKGPIDCIGKRVIGFNGDQRTDSHGGVPAYRNRTVTTAGPSQFRIVDLVQRVAGAAAADLAVDDHIVMQMQGGTLKLQRCKD